MADVNSLYNDAEKLKDEGQFDQAVARLEELLKVDPNHVLSYLALAVLYGKLGRPEDAIRAGQKACEIDPSDAFNFTAMSVTYQRAWQATQDQNYIRLAEDAMAKAHLIMGRH